MSRTSVDQDESLYVVVAIIVLCAFMLVLVTYTAMEGYAPRSTIVGLTLTSVFLMALGVILLLMAIKAMPLRIYEAGFTLYWVGIKDGWRRRETLMPKERIMVVDIVERKYGEYIMVRYDDGPLTSATRYLDTFNESIALERLKALHRIAGRKFTNRARAYMGAES